MATHLQKNNIEFHNLYIVELKISLGFYTIFSIMLEYTPSILTC